jgi:hypothetical protein
VANMVCELLIDRSIKPDQKKERRVRRFHSATRRRTRRTRRTRRSRPRSRPRAAPRRCRGCGSSLAACCSCSRVTLLIDQSQMSRPVRGPARETSEPAVGPRRPTRSGSTSRPSRRGRHRRSFGRTPAAAGEIFDLGLPFAVPVVGRLMQDARAAPKPARDAGRRSRHAPSANA